MQKTLNSIIWNTIALIQDDSQRYDFMSVFHCGVAKLYEAVTGTDATEAANPEQQVKHEGFVEALYDVCDRLNVTRYSTARSQWWALSDAISDYQEDHDCGEREAATAIFEKALI